MEAELNEDQKCMLRLQAGDESAFDELFERYKLPLFKLIFRYFNDRDLAEELTQETFVRIYEAKLTYHPTRSLKGWFYSIATHLCLNTLRKRKRESSLEGSSRDDMPAVEFEDRKHPGPQEEFSQSELARAVGDALQHLPETQRLLVLLVHYDNASITEAAKMIGITPLGARLRLFRARERLRVLLASLQPERND